MKMMKKLIFLIILKFILSKICQNKNNNYNLQIRHYCIQIHDISWNYAPDSTESKYDLLDSNEDIAKIQLSNGGLNIGRVYKKAILKEHEYKSGLCQWDEPAINFNSQNGILGPTIRGVVGDTLVIHFYNNAETLYTHSNSNPEDDDYTKGLEFNLIPQGLEYGYTKSIGYKEETYYEWTVPESAGPSDGSKFSSKLWMYSSNIQSLHDLHSGILGPIVIIDPTYVISSYQKSIAFACDVNNEIFLLSAAFSEAHSWYLKYNLENYLPMLNYEKIRTNSSFISANTKFSLNGFMYGNLNPNIGNKIPIDSHIRIYVLSIGIDSLPREIYFDGNEIIISGNVKTNAIEVTTTGYSIGDMFTSSKTGIWVISSQTSNDMKLGMKGTYEVSKNKSKQNDHNKLSAGGIAGITIMLIVLCGCTGYFFYKRRSKSLSNELNRRNSDFDECFGDCSTHSVDSINLTTDDTSFLKNNNNNNNNNNTKNNLFPLNFNVKQMNFNNSILQKTIEKLNGGNNNNHNNMNNNNNNLFTITTDSDHNDGTYSDDEDYVQNPIQSLQNNKQSLHSNSEHSHSSDSTLQVIHLSPLEMSSANYQSKPLPSTTYSSSRDQSKTSSINSQGLSLYNGAQPPKNSAFSIDSSEDRL